MPPPSHDTAPLFPFLYRPDYLLMCIVLHSSALLYSTVPQDLGVHVMYNELKKRGLSPTSIRFVVGPSNGGIRYVYAFLTSFSPLTSYILVHPIIGPHVVSRLSLTSPLLPSPAFLV